MTDLLRVDGAAINDTFKGLSENWVKRLLHIEIQDTISERKNNAALEALKCGLISHGLN